MRDILTDEERRSRKKVANNSQLIRPMWNLEADEAKKGFEPNESSGPQARTNLSASFFCAAVEAVKMVRFL